MIGVLAPQTAFGATFLVTNNNDSGAGSLRQAILDSNATVGANIIQWSGIGGTVTSASALPDITRAVTFDVTAATSEPFVGGDLRLDASLTVKGQMTYNGVISGPSFILKTQASTALTLNGTNTYSAGTAIDGFHSTVVISRDENLGDAATPVNFSNNGRMVIVGNAVSSRTFNLIGSGFDTIDVGGGYTPVLLGHMTGAGQLTKQAAGSLVIIGSVTITGGVLANGGYLVLAGTNTYGNFLSIQSGATVGFYKQANLSAVPIYSYGTLKALDNATLSNNFGGQTGLGYPAAHFDTNGFDLTMTGVIITTTALSKGGSGNWILTGNSTGYTGSIRVDQGYLMNTSTASIGSSTITLNGGGYAFATTNALTNIVAISTHGGSIDTRGLNASITSVVSGAGSLTKVGSGTLTMSGANVYTGATAVSSGALALSGAAGITGTLSVASGASFSMSAITAASMTVASLSGAGGVALGAKTLGAGSDGSDATFSGAMSGTGSLDKVGSGVLTLSGANTYTGGTTISAGTLRMGANAALAANSSLTAASGSIFDLREYTQSLGYFGGQGSLATSIASPAAFGSLTAVTANISTTTLRVTLNAFIPSSGSSFLILQSTSITGQFAGLVNPSIATFTIVYSTYGATLMISASSFSSIGSNGNQAAVGQMLDAARANATGDMQTVFTVLDNLTAEQLRGALTQIGPASLGAMAGIAGPAAAAQGAAVSNRTAALRSGEANGTRLTYSRVQGKQWYPGVSYAAAPGDVESLGAPGISPWGFYAAMLGSVGRLKSRDGIPGYSFNAQGLSCGMDHRLWEDAAALGLSLGLVKSHAGIDDSGGTVEGTSLKWGLYGTAMRSIWHAEFYLGGAANYYSTRRNIVAVSRQAGASPHGSEFNSKIGFGADYKTDRMIFSPSVAANFDEQMIGPFTEGGAGALNLAVARQKAHSLRSSAGLKVSRRFDGWTPYLSGAWQYDWHEPGRSITAQLANGAGALFSVRTAAPGRAAALVSAGVDSRLTKSVTGHASYDGEYRNGFASHTLNANLRYRF